MDDDRNEQWPRRYQSPLRRRILQESRSQAREYRRKPQQRHYRAPGFSGTAVFDLKNGMSKLPLAKRKNAKPQQSLLHSLRPNDEMTYDQEELLEMSPDDYHATIMRELDSIEQASRSNTLSPSPALSADTILANVNDYSVRNEGEQPLYQEMTYPVDHAVRLTRPITEEQLIAEVKAIYAGLVMSKKKCVEISEAQSSSQKRLSDQQWDALVALHRTLLQEHHDFFSASQHPSASTTLKSLASKYAMPAHMWRHSMHQFLDLLRYRSPNMNKHIASFGDLCAEMMQKFVHDIPQLSHEWELIQENLHQYFIELHAEGLSIPSSLIHRFARDGTWWSQLRKSLFPPMHGHFFGDDDLPDWYLAENFPNGFLDFREEPDDPDFGNDTLLGTAQLIMSGWVQYGRKIATSFHVYCQVAIFLATITITASLLCTDT